MTSSNAPRIERCNVVAALLDRKEADMAPRTRQGLNEHGLYNSARDERDACGFGMVAQLDDQPSRSLVDTAIAALS
ncbi:hypothetical protein BRM87_04525, partial [Xanthomonas oryzae pv. oryzae]